MLTKRRYAVHAHDTSSRIHKCETGRLERDNIRDISTDRRHQRVPPKGPVTDGVLAAGSNLVEHYQIL